MNIAMNIYLDQLSGNIVSVIMMCTMSGGQLKEKQNVWDKKKREQSTSNYGQRFYMAI